MGDKAEIKVGQIWKRKLGGELVRVEVLQKWYGQNDVHWRGVDYPGRGAVWEFNFRNRYDLQPAPAHERKAT